MIRTIAALLAFTVLAPVATAAHYRNAAPAFTLRGELQAQLNRDVARIENTAARYGADACVLAWIHVTESNGRTTTLSADCNLFSGYVEFELNRDRKLERDLYRRASAATLRLENIATKHGATVHCIEFTVDYLDSRGRPGNFCVIGGYC